MASIAGTTSAGSIFENGGNAASLSRGLSVDMQSSGGIDSVAFAHAEIKLGFRGLLTLCHAAAPSAVCLQGEEERKRRMSILRRVMTQPCGQTAPARRVAPQRPPYGGARLDHGTTMALRHAPCLATAAEATRLARHSVSRP